MLGYVLSACLIFLIGLGIMTIITIHKTERLAWNKGKCECGGNWRLLSEDYCINTYICDKCLHAISITTGIDRK